MKTFMKKVPLIDNELFLNVLFDLFIKNPFINKIELLCTYEH